jgi:O-antigen ligase
LFFGHGYGAIWSFSDFRLGLQAELGWGYPVLIGDNGLVDILLHLGIIGAGIMVFIILFSLVKAVKSAFTHKSLLSFFPLIAIVYIIVCNISLSLLIELEYLTWALLITSIVISIQHNVKIIPVPIENPD